jgi:membrane protein YdbS with pleckstrin-like domain
MNQEKLLSLKPEFVIKKNLLLNSLAWLPISVAGGVEAAIIYLSYTHGQVFSPIAAYACLLVTLILLMFLTTLGFFDEKLNYKTTEYSVYNNRVEFSEGFLNSDITTIMLADVKEIHLKRSFVQKKCDLGTIRFVTNSNSYRPFNSNIHSTGINFRDIKNSASVYEEIKKLVESNKK